MNVTYVATDEPPYGNKAVMDRILALEAENTRLRALLRDLVDAADALAFAEAYCGPALNAARDALQPPAAER